MSAIRFSARFREDLQWWFKKNPKTAYKILDLVEAICQEPFGGIGKPERLKYLNPNIWSRRITQEHRLVYRVTQERIDFLAARYHY